MKSLGCALTQHDWNPCKKRGLGRRQTQRKDDVKTQGEDAGNKPRREASDTLISGFWPPEL